MVFQVEANLVQPYLGVTSKEDFIEVVVHFKPGNFKRLFPPEP